MAKDVTFKAILKKKENGIQTMVYCYVPLHKMKTFHGRVELFGNLARSDFASTSVSSLPIDPFYENRDDRKNL